VIGGDITLVCVMTLDPDELGSPTLGLPLIEPVAHELDKILVLDGAAACSPAIAFPVDVPLRNALDRVLAVSTNLEVLFQVDDLEGAEDRCELGALIGLGFALQALRDISIVEALVSFKLQLVWDCWKTNLGSLSPK
jgi:hypothetical protein